MLHNLPNLGVPANHRATFYTAQWLIGGEKMAKYNNALCPLSTYARVCLSHSLVKDFNDPENCLKNHISWCCISEIDWSFAIQGDVLDSIVSEIGNKITNI